MQRLKRRADFLAARDGARAPAGAFFVQARDRHDAAEPRIGFTVTKKTGSAVERNRIRRRLREAAKNVMSAAGRPKHGQTGASGFLGYAALWSCSTGTEAPHAVK